MIKVSVNGLVGRMAGRIKTEKPSHKI